MALTPKIWGLKIVGPVELHTETCSFEGRFPLVQKYGKFSF